MSDLISRQAAIEIVDRYNKSHMILQGKPMLGAASIVIELEALPSAQPDIKQAAKLLSGFIESCPGGDSYLIAPDGEELRTDWGYAMEGIQLINDWAERRTDG